MKKMTKEAHKMKEYESALELFNAYMELAHIPVGALAEGDTWEFIELDQYILALIRKDRGEK